MAAVEPDAEQAKEPKSGRGLWRDRLKDKANKLTKGRGQAVQQEKDVADFLRSGSSTSVNSEPRINPTPPRIDTGQWIAAGGGATAPEDRLEPLGFPTQAQPKKRFPKPPGTHVSFTHEEPAVIGEGGDECELPANQVIGSWSPSTAEHEPHERPRADSTFEPPPTILQAGNQENREKVLQRSLTGLRPPEESWAQKRLSMSMEEGLIQAKKEDPFEDPPQREPQLPAISLGSQFSNISLEPEKPPQAIESKSYVTGHSEGAKPYSSNPPNGSDSNSSGFLAYNPSLRKPENPRPVSNEVSSDMPPDTALPKSSTDPSRAIYPDGATIPQSSHDNLLHQPKVEDHQSPFPSPVFDKYGEMPNIQDQLSTTPEAVAAQEFFTRMQHMRGIFRLTAERPGAVGSHGLGQWLRASMWWFLRGKTELESAARAPSGPDPFLGRGEDNLPSNKQCYVDMAKAWWIIQEIVPGIIEGPDPVSIADKADGLEYEDLLAVLERMKWEMSRYFLKLDGRGMLPPPELLVQGADPEIWIAYPPLPPGIYALTASLNPRTLTRQAPAKPHFALSMPLSDSEAAFSYGRFFGFAHILGDPDFPNNPRMPCVVSIVRDRAVMLAEFLVTTQDGQINLHIQSDKRIGPAWGSVKWNAKGNSMLIVLMGEVAVEVQLREPDFRILYGVHDYNHKLESERLPRLDEELLFGDVVHTFHFMGPKDAKTGFPPQPVQDCKVRLFQRAFVDKESAATRKIFRSYRLSVTSPSTVKTLSNMSRPFRENAPILFNNLRGENGAPALALVMDEGDKPASLIFTFESSMKRAAFYTILAGTATSPDECFSEDIPVHSFAVANITHGATSTPATAVTHPMPQGLQWQQLKVINVGHNLDEAPCVLSDRLRVCISCNFGSITDRINLGVGELRIGLDHQDTTMIKLYRPAQNNLTISMLETSMHRRDVAQLSEILTAIHDQPTCRVYRFLSLPVLHDFQALATGLSVAYDGRASHFSIARRRILLALHKQMETDHARLQILRQGTKVLLVAFFKDFTAGACMCLELHGTDVYEASSQGSKFMVRFVDAKFTMPKPFTEPGHDLVCLDTVEHSEHDDLVFGFDSEDDRNLFAQALPAGMGKGSRMASFRR